MGSDSLEVHDRADAVERLFTGPVIAAAIASVPAMLLTTMDGAAQQIGSTINVLTLVVFLSETAVLLALTRDRIDWARRHRFTLLVTLASIPAVVLAVGPVQVLRLVRLVRLVGALRILRVRRIVRAGRVLRTRAGLTGWAWRATFLLLSGLAAIFVAFVLADPSSPTRQVIDTSVGRFGTLATVAAGLILGFATFIVVRARRTDEPATGSHRSPRSGPDEGDQASPRRGDDEEIFDGLNLDAECIEGRDPTQTVGARMITKRSNPSP